MITIFTTIGENEAENFAQKLIENRLAACVSISPNIKSVYRWEGKIECENETLLIIKTTEEKLPAIREFFDKNHSYKLPEFVYTNCLASEKYLEWVMSNVKTDI